MVHYGRAAAAGMSQPLALHRADLAGQDVMKEYLSAKFLNKTAKAHKKEII